LDKTPTAHDDHNGAAGILKERRGSRLGVGFLGSQQTSATDWKMSFAVMVLLLEVGDDYGALAVGLG